MEDIRTIVTHNGVFHLDEIAAIVFIERCLDRHLEIIRTNNPKNYESFNNCLIVDIGGGQFDHHGNTMEYRDENQNWPYASFGKIVREFWPMVFSEREYKKFDDNFVKYVDAYDCGKPIHNEISSYVHDANPTWEDYDKNKDGSYSMKLFNETKEIIRSIINTKINNIIVAFKADKIIEKAAKNAINGIAKFDFWVPNANKISENIKFYIMPSNRDEGYWNLFPVSIRRGEYRKEFPHEWYGKTKEEANNIQEGMTFCHASGCMAVFSSYEYAYSAAEYCMGI